ncbi:MAG: UDP-N-acetylglucosamine 2-epimerase [Eubacterium sp.]|nr:UDP-N-acetylglucosamine 2-epimerase [Eubacterium sp.]
MKVQKDRKRVLFITGTRADYGKIKSLMKHMDVLDQYDVYIYVSGMHLLPKYGSTYKEVLKDGYQNVYVAFGQQISDNMSLNLGSILTSMTSYIQHIEPDMIVVHGDRIDALAGAIAGALNNILVAHIEGGELSGTIDDSIRHSISKFAHIHFVCNEEAKKRIIQLGEDESRIFIIGSPDIDVMLGDGLPKLSYSKLYYEIFFEKYGIFMYHPVTTELYELASHTSIVVDALKESGRNYIVVYPNNDLGTEIVLEAIHDLENDEHFRVFPSIRFEHFLTLLKNADFIIGNSSAGIRESGVYGVPAIDIGSRQQGRYDIQALKNIIHVDEDKDEILSAINDVDSYRIKQSAFGKGDSTEQFMSVLNDATIWKSQIQKSFKDISEVVV